jgi:hypothetical protein
MSIIIRGCRYPANYFNLAYPMYQSPHGAIYNKFPTYYQDYEDIHQRIWELRKKAREAKYEFTRQQKASSFWESYFKRHAFTGEEMKPKHQDEPNYPYCVFGLKKSASQEDVKKKYRKMILVSHPDKPEGSNELFIKIQDAWNYFKSHFI